MAENAPKASPEIATLTPQEAKNAIAFLGKPMQMQGGDSQIHAALLFKLNLIATGQPMPAMPDNVSELNGLTGSSKE